MFEDNGNELLLQSICKFADSMLKEVLERRSQLNYEFYLPGMPVTDEELVNSLSNTMIYSRSSSELKEKWQELLKVITVDYVDRESPRMMQLCYLYGLKEIWILAVIITYVYQVDSKYEKAILMLQGDSGRKRPDVFLINALAYYLGIDCKMSELIAQSRVKNELFETLLDGQLLIRDYVFLWLNKKENIKPLRNDLYTIYTSNEKDSVIRLQELEWCSEVAKRQCEDRVEKQLVFELQGNTGAGKKTFCVEVAKRVGYKLCAVKIHTLLEYPEKELQNVLQEIYFKCVVNGCLLYVDLGNCTDESARIVQYVKEIISEYLIVFIGTRPDSLVISKLSISTHQLSFDKLSMKDSLALWKWIGKKYMVEESLDYEQLAGRYRLLPGAIEEVFNRAERYRWKNNMPAIDFPLLLSCIRESNQVISNNLMERIDTVFKWEDLHVEPQVISNMQLACAHIKYRFSFQETMGKAFPYGNGVGVLMYGPPGTGKTMAAQVIANELQMDLYRVDLSQVSSKYIGETEKNLEKIFKEAEQANVILFFDEADSMFGKRTEVKDSNDKYANQETSYILQRIESYEGMVILATNYAQNFDSAFMRRITVSIHFSAPDEEMRKHLWKDMLKHSDLANDNNTIDALAAQFELTGSNIKNIVRNAEFLAQMKQSKLTIVEVIMAIKLEFEKLGKMCNATTLGRFVMYV